MDERDDDLLDEEPLGLFDQDGPGLFDSPEPASATTEDDDWIDAELDTLESVEESPATVHESPPESDASAVDARLAAALDSVTAGHRHERVDRPEAPLALYRRYRPDTFADIIGQDHVTEPLQRALVNNRVNHAYLFSGPRGCGKTTSARILARALNCVNGPAPIPCGQCQSCRDLARGGAGSIDVIEIDAASHGGVNEARDLRERAFFAPVHSRYKIYIIDEAHMVTKEGFNALLKVVEEPPPHVKFIFATTEPDKVLGTIRSRTHHYPFRLVPPKTLTAYLAGLCVAEGVEVEPSVLPLVVRAGAGSVRDSLSVLDQLLGGASTGGVTYRQATALLGYTPDALLDEIMDAFAAGDAQGVFAAVDKVIEVGQDPRRFAEDLLRRLRDLIIVAAVPDALSSGLVDVADDQGQRLNAQASAMGAGELTRAAEVLAAGLTDMRGTTAPRLHLELMCARVLLPGADVDGRGVHARLDRLERRLGMPGAAGGDAEPSRPPTRAEDAAASPARGPAAPRPEPQDAAGPHASRSSAGMPGSARTDAPATAHAPATATTHAPATVTTHAPATVTTHAPAPVSAHTPAPTTAEAPPPASTHVAPAPPRPSGAQSGSASEPGRHEARDDRGSPATDEAPRATSPIQATSAGGALTTADLRRLWPEVLEEVKNRRRFTWILLSQNAQVIDLRQGVLTLGIANAGARDSYGRGGSDEVLREAILTVVGATLRIDVIIDPGVDAAGKPSGPAGAAPRPAATGAAAAAVEAWPPAAAGSSAASTSEAGSASGQSTPPWSTEEPAEPASPSSPSSPPSPGSPNSPTSPRSPSSPSGPDLAAAARANIRPTRSTALTEAPEEEPSRDDQSVEEADTSFDELLVKHLGAELIGEEEVTPGQ